MLTVPNQLNGYVPNSIKKKNIYCKYMFINYTNTTPYYVLGSDISALVNKSRKYYNFPKIDVILTCNIFLRILNR